MNDAAEETTGKGGPTRSRKEAEAARKQQMKRPLTRKEQAERERHRRNSQRDRQREALMGGGSNDDLPLRDRGPARALARDVVDRRRTVAEFMLPFLLLILIVSLFAPAVVVVPWIVVILATTVDEVWLVLSLRRENKARLDPAQQKKGNVLYAVLRSTQLRRMRLPKPALPIGAPLRDRY